MGTEIRTYKCIIVDDEPIAIKIIKSFLQGIESIEIVKECRNATQAFEIIQRKKIDLIFLDINMPGLSGLGLLKSLSNPPKIILTTAHREYAIDGFDLEVLDFLLKPISQERFLKALNRFFRSYDSGISDLKPVRTKEEDTIFIRAGRQTHQLNMANTLYIESQKEYVLIHTKESNIKLKGRLDEIENTLPKGRFVRIHKSYLVAIHQILSFDSHEVRTSAITLPVSRGYRHTFLQYIETFNGS